MNGVVREAVRQHLREASVARLPVDDEASLVDAGVIDSAGVFMLVSFLEERFEISIPEADLSWENFDSVASVDAYLAALLARTEVP